MADFRIVDIFTQDGQLVVKAEHFRPDGSAWFTENYTWQGREGLKQKRATNALGQLLLDDGTVAPSDPDPNVPGRRNFRLPPGRTWALRPGPHMDESSILSTIRSIHRQRLLTGWPNTVDRLGNFRPKPEDVTGCPALLARFQALLGREYIL